MSILGSLVISLTAETQSFIVGMTGASKTARTVGNEIETSFSRIGQVAETALAPLGEFGKFIGETFSGIGTSAGVAIRAMGNLSGGATALGVGLGATAGAMAAVTLGSVALVTHTNEQIAKMGELAQSTGLSVESLSALSFVFAETGVNSEVGVKGLERLDKAIFKAATSAPGTVNAFTRMHVAVRDSEGQMRGLEPVLLDLADKFAHMPDGVTKTGLAMELFGAKIGAALLPALNRGRDGIKELEDTAKSLGLVIDSNTARAAVRFKEDLTTIEGAGQGAAIRLTKDLLPALDFLASKLVTSFKTGEAQKFIDKIADVVIFTIALGETFASAFKQWIVGGQLFQSVASKIIEGLILLRETADSPWKLFSGDFRDKLSNFNLGGGLKDAFSKFHSDSGQIWKDHAAFLLGLTSTALPIGPKAAGGGDDTDTGPKKNVVLERVKERIAALRQELLDWQALGSAGSQAEALIAEATKKSNEELAKLNKEAARDDTGLSAKTVARNEGLARAAGAASVYGTAIKALTSDLDKQGLKLTEQDKAAVSLSEAYRQGGAAIASAAIGKQFADQAAKLSVLAQVHDLLAAKLGAENPLVQQLASKLSVLTGMLKANEDEARQLASDDLNAQLEKQTFNFNALAPLVAHLSNAYLLNEDAVRRNRIELELYKFALDEQEKGIELTGAMIDSKRKQLEDADKQAYDGALKQEAARYSLLVLYDQEIERLNRVREVIQQSGQSTLLIDAQLLDAQIRLVQQWDQAAFKAGTFGERVKGVFNELIIQGKLAGEAISHAVLTAFDGAEGQLAHLIVTGKANFLGVLQSLEESVVKAGIQKAVGGLLGSFGLKLPGLGPQLGTEQNPMWVQVKGAGLAGIGGGSSSLPFSAGGAPTAIPGVVGAVGGESLGLPTGIFTQQLNTMAAAQAVFAGKMGGSWTGIVGMFRGAIGLMMGLFHIHTASMIAGQAAQTGAAVASQAAQTGAASAGAGARGNIGFAEHMKKIFQHAAGAAAGAFHSVMDNPAIPFPINVILAPIAAAGAFAGVLAWGAIGSAARGALVPEDMLMMTHKNEMVIPGDISEGLQGIIRANQGGFAPSVQQFGGPQRGGAGDEFHAHVHMGNVTAMDTVGIAEQIKKARHQVLKEVRQGFSTGYLNGRRMARV